MILQKTLKLSPCLSFVFLDSLLWIWSDLGCYWFTASSQVNSSCNIEFPSELLLCSLKKKRSNSIEMKNICANLRSKGKVKWILKKVTWVCLGVTDLFYPG